MVEYHYSNTFGRWFHGEGSQRRYMPKGFVPPKKKPMRKPPNRGNIEVSTVDIPTGTGVVTSRRRVPQISTRGTGTIVRNTELFSNLDSFALGAFTAFGVAIIPTIPSWLAGVADLYSKYRWLRVRIIYIPAVPTTTAGSGYMSLQYDRIDNLPANAISIQQNYKALTFPVYAGFEGAMALQSFANIPGMVVIDVDPERFEKKWYSCALPTTITAMPTATQTSYVPCTFIQASAGGAGAALTIGSFYLQYEIEFIEPINPTQNA